MKWNKGEHEKAPGVGGRGKGDGNGVRHAKRRLKKYGVEKGAT